MPDYISTYLHKDSKCVIKRIGDDGSFLNIVALFLAAYALDNQLESKRVMKGWILSEDPTYGTAGDWEYLPKNQCESRNTEWIQRLIAYTRLDKAWITYDANKVTTGLCKKPSKCSKLDSLISMHEELSLYYQDKTNYMQFSPDMLIDLAPYCRYLLKYLEASCLYDTLVTVVTIFETGLENNARVTIGA